MHRPPAFPFASSRLRVSPTVPKGLPCTHCVAGGTGGGTGDTAPEIPPDQPRWLLPCSDNRNTSREAAKTRSGGHTIVSREAGDTAPKPGTHHHEADCRLPANLTTPVTHLASAACVSVRVFAYSRLRVSPTVPKGLPCTHCVAGGTGGGTGDTAPGIPPDQPRWLLPCSEIRNSSREDAKTRSGGHTIVSREAGDTAPKAGDTPSRSRLQTASKSHHAGHSPCIGRLRFRSRLRGFAASRLRVSPTVPKEDEAGDTPLCRRIHGIRGHSTDGVPGTEHLESAQRRVAEYRRCRSDRSVPGQPRFHNCTD